MGATRGKDFKLYRNTAVPPTTPVWTEVGNIKDLTRNLEKALADASIRGSSFRMQVGTLKDLTIDFQMVYDPDDVHYVAFEEGFFDDTDVEILILDGPVATIGSKGLRLLAQVGTFTVNEALEDVGLTDVSLVPSYAPTAPPIRVEVTTGGTVTPLTAPGGETFMAPRSEPPSTKRAAEASTTHMSPALQAALNDMMDKAIKASFEKYGLLPVVPVTTEPEEPEAPAYQDTPIKERELVGV